MAISYEQVELIAEQLLQKQDTPTIEKIRFKLGTGSNTTISKHLREWRSKRLSARHEILPELKTPPDPVNQAVSKVWEQLQEENNAKINSIEQAYEEKSQVMLEEREAILNERDRLNMDNQELRNLLKQAKIELAEHEKTKIDLSQDNAVLNAKVAILEESFDEFKQWADGALTQLESSNSNTIKQYEFQIEKLTKTFFDEKSQMKEYAENQRHKHIAEIDRLVTENQKLNEQLSSQSHMYNTIVGKVKDLDLNISKMNNKSDDLSEIIKDNNVKNKSYLDTITEQISHKITASAHVEFKAIKKHQQDQFDDINAAIKDLKVINNESVT